VSAIRRLPIRVAPLPGEAIDSWLEAVAHRYGSTWWQLQTALGGVLKGAGYPDAWVLRLTDDQVASISAATEIDCAAIREMTLADLPGIVAGIDPGTGQTVSLFPWRHLHASRYCPSCLAVNGGRWSLAWRTVWSFACLTHRCLLASECPRCLGAQRRRIVFDLVPEPIRCAAMVDAGSPSAVARCGADLTVASVIQLDHGHPFMVAQATINDIMANRTVNFGIYRGSSCRPEQVLVDVRWLGQYFLNDCDPSMLETLVPKAMVAQLPVERPPRIPRQQRLHRACPAVTTAVAVTAALSILGQSDMYSAAKVLRSVWPVGRHGVLYNRIVYTRNGAPTSARLRSAYVTSLAPQLSVAEQLRYRIGSAVPRYPLGDIADAQRMAARMPTLLWPQWSLRLAGPQDAQRRIRPVLSVAVLLIGNRVTIGRAANLLASPPSAHAVNARLYQVKHSERWPDIREGLYRLHRYLGRDAPPIDYARRRQLDYAALLPEPEWRAICRGTGTRPEGLSTARHYLLERLSATSAFAGPVDRDDHPACEALLRFPARLTPDLSTALTDYSLRFLASQGVAGEPDYWCPPVDLLDDLHLPSPGVESIDVSHLHHLIRRCGLELWQAADQLGTTLDIVRLALEQDPAPRLPHQPETVARAGAIYHKASATLTPQRFTELYVTDGRSLRDIAAICGVSRKAVTQLAHDNSITLCRFKGRSATALTADERVPNILVPALARQGGWERLQRLPSIAEHASMSVAAEQIRKPRSVLSRQVRSIERDLGGAVLARATFDEPQRLTPLGARIVAAAKRLNALGGP
jgi:hypothetical protein